jgi:hypothetical protein
VSAGSRRDYLRAPSNAARREAVAPLPPPITIQSHPRSPGEGQPGIFLNTIVGLPAVTPKKDFARRKDLSLKSRADQFHDNELGDVYDLYNACNGELRDDGLLDVRRLDSLSAEEAEAFDVERLREVWRHTASGCERCAGIVRILNQSRGILKD